MKDGAKDIKGQELTSFFGGGAILFILLKPDPLAATWGLGCTSAGFADFDRSLASAAAEKPPQASVLLAALRVLLHGPLAAVLVELVSAGS